MTILYVVLMVEKGHRVQCVSAHSELSNAVEVMQKEAAQHKDLAFYVEKCPFEEKD